VREQVALEEFSQVAWEFVGLWLKVRNSLVVSAAMQPAPPDKLFNPPRCGGKSKGLPGLRGAKRGLRSLSRPIPASQRKFPEEDMVP